MNRLWRATIWNPANLANVPPRYQSIYTTLFPALYLLFVGYGLATLPAAVLAIDVTLGPIYGDFWSIALIAAGAGAFLGQVVRPQRPTPGHGLALKRRWQQVELMALALVIVLQVIYQVSIFASGLIDVPHTIRWQALLLVAVYAGPPLWKVRDTVRGMRSAR